MLIFLNISGVLYIFHRFMAGIAILVGVKVRIMTVARTRVVVQIQKTRTIHVVIVEEQAE